jgi:hypothetical protein
MLIIGYRTGAAHIHGRMGSSSLLTMFAPVGVEA